MGEKYIIFGTGASAAKDYDSLNTVVSCALEHGIRGFDTAPSYGVEGILSKIIYENLPRIGLEREDIIIQTKIDGWQMMDGHIQQFVDETLRKMNIQYIDHLLIHWPFPEYFDDTWSSFEFLKKYGKVKKIGICNVRIRHLREYENKGLKPDIIQIERNPLRTCEREVEFCNQHNIELQAYSPLCKMDKRIAESTILKKISEKYQKNIGQIVLRWHLDTGANPIFTSTKKERVIQYTELEDFSLTEKDILQISALNMNYKYYLESCLCPGI